MIIDTQSVRAAAGVPKTTTGLDANKKVSGPKRGLAVEVLGLILVAHTSVLGTMTPKAACVRLTGCPDGPGRFS